MTVQKIKLNLFFIITLILSNGWNNGSVYAAIDSYENYTKEISKNLKPISNQDWNKIAGEISSQEYSIIKGDTLYDISKRLFGDPLYWPKIWSLNNSSIFNPHLIYPGNFLAFLAGSGTTLPGVQVGKISDTFSQSEESDNTEEGSSKSDEWKFLPKQSWETVNFSKPTEIDPYGFDKRSKITFSNSKGVHLKYFIMTKEPLVYGAIAGSPEEKTLLSLNDLVSIEGDTRIAVGDQYTISEVPEDITNSKSSRPGISFQDLGTVKILAQTDEGYIGRITNSFGIIQRGSLLIKQRENIIISQRIPGPARLEAIILKDPLDPTVHIAQHHIVYLDKGAIDGVKPGMVFRKYRQLDPVTDEEMTFNHVIPQADILVLDVSSEHCTGVVVDSTDELVVGNSVYLINNVNELYKKIGETYNIGKGIDELDGLYRTEGLTDEDQITLKQLEQWQQNPREEEYDPYYDDDKTWDKDFNQELEGDSFNEDFDEDLDIDKEFDPDVNQDQRFEEELEGDTFNDEFDKGLDQDAEFRGEDEFQSDELNDSFDSFDSSDIENEINSNPTSGEEESIFKTYQQSDVNDMDEFVE